jgi:lysophospholipase L1-like esterase
MAPAWKARRFRPMESQRNRCLSPLSARVGLRAVERAGARFPEGAGSKESSRSLVKPIAARALLCLASFGLVLAGAELALRATRGTGASDERAPFNPYRPDAALGYALRPGWSGRQASHEFDVRVETNGRGLRRKAETPTAKPPATRRLLVLGDSLAFGFGVSNDAMFTRRLEQALRGRDPHVEVLNAGVPGYSSDHHLVYLREQGFELDPDAILIVTCSNDIDDLAWSRPQLDAQALPLRTSSRRRMIDRRGRMRYLNEAGQRLPRWLEAPPGWLVRHSALVHWLRFRIAALWLGALESEAGAPVAQAQARDANVEGRFSEMDEDEIQAALAASATFRRRYYGHLNTAIEKLAAEAQVPLRFVHLGPEAGEVARDCAQRDACIDLQPRVSFTREAALRHPDDRHPNARGHREIADVIAAEALHALLPPGP